LLVQIKDPTESRSRGSGTNNTSSRGGGRAGTDRNGGRGGANQFGSSGMQTMGVELIHSLLWTVYLMKLIVSATIIFFYYNYLNFCPFLGGQIMVCRGSLYTRRKMGHPLMEGLHPLHLVCWETMRT